MYYLTGFISKAHPSTISLDDFIQTVDCFLINIVEYLLLFLLILFSFLSNYFSLKWFWMQHTPLGALYDHCWLNHVTKNKENKINCLCEHLHLVWYSSSLIIIMFDSWQTVMSYLYFSIQEFPNGVLMIYYLCHFPGDQTNKSS